MRKAYTLVFGFFLCLTSQATRADTTVCDSPDLRLQRMIDNHGLHVEVRDGEIVVTLPRTRFAVTYYKLPNDPQLYLHVRSFPTQQDRDAGMTAEEFLAEAW